jgi:hypothetical protein
MANPACRLLNKRPGDDYTPNPQIFNPKPPPKELVHRACPLPSSCPATQTHQEKIEIRLRRMRTGSGKGDEKTKDLWAHLDIDKRSMDNQAGLQHRRGAG